MIIDNSRNEKLEGSGCVVQVDVTGLDYNVKSHSWRASTNKTDAICLVEYSNNTTRVWADVILKKT